MAIRLPRSIRALLLGGLSSILMLPAPVHAARSAKACATVVRKAKARLARALVVCGKRRDTEAAGACGAAGWTRYTARLVERGCPAAAGGPARRIGRPVLAKLGGEFSADDLADADADARAAHLALRRLLERVVRAAAAARTGAAASLAKLPALAQELADAVAVVDDAETTLAELEDAIWHGFRGEPGLPWLVDEPLRAAMQQLQIETRRLLGPEWTTEIAGLGDQPGCRGDLVGDRMLATYGEGVLQTGKDRSAEVAALGRLAGQLACMSVRQAALFDVALSVASDRVERLLDEAGLARIRGAFARLVAPVEVLLLDTVKLAGDHAYAWHWFVRHPDLRDEVVRLGWATNDVLWLYDRIDGRLIGFPPCAPAEGPGRCVDLGAFVDSLTDPRALGLGDCALSGMVAGGLRQAAGVSRYVCPSADCGGSSTGGTGSRGGRTLPGTSFGGRPLPGGSSSRGSGASPGSLPWQGLGTSDLTAMRELGCSAGSGGGGGSSNGENGGTQGPRGSLDDWSGDQECVAAALSGPRDPYATYVRCVAAVADGTRAAQSDLSGVPMGPSCGPGVAQSTGGSTPASGSGSTTTVPASGASTTTVTTTDSTSTTAPPSTPKPCDPTGILDAIQKIFDCGLAPLEKALTGETPKPSGPGAVVSIEVELLKPENGQVIYDSAGAIMQHKVDLACAAGQLSDDECSQLATMKPGEQADFLRKTGHLKDCADPDDCDSECTSLDEQVMTRMQDCEQDLTDALTPTPVGPHDPGAVSHPSPDADPGTLPADPLMSCLLHGADDGPSGMDLGCALVSCPSAGAVARVGSACCGAATPTIGVSVSRILSERTCQTVHCTDGAAAVADGLGDCGCGGAGTPGGGTPPSPAPSPEKPGRPAR